MRGAGLENENDFKVIVVYRHATTKLDNAKKSSYSKRRK